MRPLLYAAVFSLVSLQAVAETLSIPVLARPVARGEVIAFSDLKDGNLDKKRLIGGMATDSAEIVGQMAKRSLSPGQPIMIRDVMPPLLVKKGDIVTIALDNPMMKITAQGKALDDGAKDQTVRILNTTSKRVIEATVTQTGRVTVEMPL